MATRRPSFIQRLNASRAQVGARRLDAALRATDEQQAAVDRIRKTYRWRCVRDQVLRREPLCRPCNTAGRTELGVHVDHIRSLLMRPDLAYSLENLQPICASCHARKNAVERGYTPRSGS